MWTRIHSNELLAYFYSFFFFFHTRAFLSPIRTCPKSTHKRVVAERPPECAASGATRSSRRARCARRQRRACHLDGDESALRPCWRLVAEATLFLRDQCLSRPATSKYKIRLRGERKRDEKKFGNNFSIRNGKKIPTRFYTHFFFYSSLKYAFFSR